jgi:hypothetical protein
VDEARERIIRIIRKLQNVQVEKGFSPAEAAGAMEKASQLLQEHQLSLVEIEESGPKLNEALGETVVNTRRRRRNPGESLLTSAVAAGCDCRVIFTYQDRNYCYAFIGYQSDIEVAKYLFEYLRDGLTAEADRQARAQGLSKSALVRYRNNFLMAASGEIRKRLKAEKEKADAEETAAPAEQPGQTTKQFSLVAIKAPEVEKFLHQAHPKLHSGHPSAFVPTPRRSRPDATQGGPFRFARRSSPSGRWHWRIKGLPKMIRFFEPTDKFLNWLAKYAGKRLVFDVGCGDGHITRELVKRKVKCLGIDPRYRWEPVPSRMHNLILPMEAERVSILATTPKSLVLFCRPCHNGFVLNTIRRLHPTTEVLYISKPKNLVVDTCDLDYDELAAPPCEEERCIGFTYLKRRGLSHESLRLLRLRRIHLQDPGRRVRRGSRLPYRTLSR